MDQPDLFVPADDLYESLRVLVMRLGGTKRVGLKLRPELSMEQASIWLNNCLNRERSEKLDIDQIDMLIGLGRKAGIHVVVDTIGARHNYRVEPIDPEYQLAKLKREFIEQSKHTREMLERIERLETNPVMRAVK